MVVTSAYPELTHMVQEIAGELNVNVIVIEAVLEDALEQVEKVMGKHRVDVLVSRGGTAELLKQRFHLPVISAAPSEFDILLALAKAKEQNTQIGYFSYPTVTDQGFLAQVKSILGIDIIHYTYTNATEMATQMEAAYRQG
ncbi:MAG TPA: PrpR N-terminal domain-containing protein, partial [Verrucomicrobiae bacterium]|nr:PrpR N-terminal domain-containing protein [Verrucomicrobiae bacterium]